MHIWCLFCGNDFGETCKTVTNASTLLPFRLNQTFPSSSWPPPLVPPSHLNKKKKKGDATEDGGKDEGVLQHKVNRTDAMASCLMAFTLFSVLPSPILTLFILFVQYFSSFFLSVFVLKKVVDYFVAIVCEYVAI